MSPLDYRVAKTTNMCSCGQNTAQASDRHRLAFVVSPAVTAHNPVSLCRHAGLIRPLPAVVFPIEEAPDALRQLSAAKHIGKVVVEVLRQLPALKDAQGRWVVSGGLGALGSLSVQWLASQGMHTKPGSQTTDQTLAIGHSGCFSDT